MITEYQAAMKRAAGDTAAMAKSAQGSFTELNKKVGELGTELTRKVTVPLVATGAGALKLASDFETSFAQMVGLAGVAGDEVAGLREEVLKLAHDTAQSPQKLAEALYFIRSSGIDAAHAMGVLEVAAKASAAGLGDAAVVADAVTSAMNAYGEANLSAQQATDILVSAVREGKTEAAALAPQLGVLIPTAAAMGISFSQVAGILAVMSRTGLDAAEASTSLNAVFSTLLGTSKEGTKLLEEKKLSLQGLRDTAAGPGGVVEVMRQLDKAFQGDDEALATIIPNVRAFRGFMNVLAQDAGSVDQVLQNVAESTGATNDAFSKMKATEAFKIKQSFVDLQTTLIKLGAVLAPIVAMFADGLATVVSGFDMLPGSMKQVVVWLGIIAATSGPAMKAISLIGDVGGPAIKLVIGSLKALRAEIVASQIAGASYGRAIATSLAPAALGFGAVGVAVAGLAIIMNDYNSKKARTVALTQQLVLDLKNELAAANQLSAVHIGEDLLSGGLGESLREAQAFIPILVDTVRQGSPVLDQAMKDLSVGVDEVVVHLREAAKNADPLAQELLRIGSTGKLTSAEFVQLIRLLGSQSGAYQTASRDAANAAYATEQVGDKAAGTAGAVSDLSGGLYGLGTAAGDAEAQLKALLGTLDAIYGGAFDVADAQQGFADALADVDSAARASGGGGVRDLTNQQRQLEKATKDVTKAQQELVAAEQALADARKGATPREKSDAGLGVREAQLGVKEAIKAQSDARQRLLEERKKGKAGDTAGAQLDVERSAISLKRAQDRLTDAQAEQNKVMHSGEETSDKVKSALDDVKAAQERVTDATQGQLDAEAQLRGEGASGGPVADRARAIRGSYDQMVSSAKDWITKLLEQKRPTSELVAALDEQSAAAQRLIDAYGDPDGKLAKFIDANDRLRLIFTDAKFISNFRAIADAIGGKLGVVIPDFFGSDSTGRAKGGPVVPFTTYQMGEEGPEALTIGATSAPKKASADDSTEESGNAGRARSTRAGVMSPPDQRGKGQASAEMSGRSAMGARTFMVGLDGPQLVTMGAEPGWVTPNARLGDIDGARAKGGPVRAGGTYLVGEDGPEIIEVGGFESTQRMLERRTAIDRSDSTQRLVERAKLRERFTERVRSILQAIHERTSSKESASDRSTTDRSTARESTSTERTAASRSSDSATRTAINSDSTAITDRTATERATDTSATASESTTSATRADSLRDHTSASETLRERSSADTQRSSVESQTSAAPLPTLPATPLYVRVNNAVQEAAQQLGLPPIDLGIEQVASGPYRMTVDGPKPLTPKPRPAGMTSSVSSTSEIQTFDIGLDGPEVITMGAQPGWVHSDVRTFEGRANGGPVAAGQTYLVGERGPEVITIGGMVTSRHVATHDKSATSARSTDRQTSQTVTSAERSERVTTPGSYYGNDSSSSDRNTSRESSLTDMRSSTSTAVRDSEREREVLVDARRATQYADLSAPAAAGATAAPWSGPMTAAAGGGATMNGGDLIVNVHGPVMGSEARTFVYNALKDWTRHNGALRLPTKSPY